VLRVVDTFCNRSADGKYTVQKMILGTHTADEEPNFLQIATVQLPDENNLPHTQTVDQDGSK
jgi:histone-binding protein RBBP4